MKYNFILLTCLLLLGCGSSDAPSQEQKKTPDAPPLTTEFKAQITELSFTGGAVKDFLVQGKDIIAIDTRRGLHKYKNNTWEKLSATGSELVSTPDYILTSKGYRSHDFGATWEKLDFDDIWSITFHKSSDVLYGLQSGTLVSSTDFGQSWAVENSELAFLKITSYGDELVLLAQQESNNVYRLNTDNAVLTQLTTPDRVYEIAATNSVIAISTVGDVHTSVDHGLSWTKAVYEDGNVGLFAEFLTINNAIYTKIQGQIFQLTDQIVFKYNHMLSYQGIINHASQEGDYLYWSNDVGLYKGLMSDFLGNNENHNERALIGRESYYIDKLVSDGQTDYYQIGKGNKQLINLNSQELIHIGRLLITSVVKLSDNEAIVSFRSRYEAGTGGLKLFNINPKHTKDLYRGSDAESVYSINNNLLLHLKESPHGRSNYVVLSTDGGESWSDLDNLNPDHSIMHSVVSESCQKIWLDSVVNGSTLMSNSTENLAYATNTWEIEYEIEQSINGIDSFDEQLLFWSQDTIFLKPECDATIENYQVPLKAGDNISAAKLLGDHMLIGTTHGYLYHFSNGKFLEKKLSDNEVLQIFQTQDSRLLLRTTVNTLEVEY